MSLSTLPQPIKAFLQATASRDRAALLAAFANDAVLVDMGKEHRGDEIPRWMDSLYLGSNVRVPPLHTEERDGRTVLAVAVDGDYAALGVTEPFQLDWHIDLAGDRIARLRMVEEKLDLPAPVLGFVQAMNMYDLDGMVSRFAPDAIANDQMRHYAGREAIRACLAKEIAGDRGDDVRHRDPAPSERRRRARQSDRRLRQDRPPRPARAYCESHTDIRRHQKAAIV